MIIRYEQATPAHLMAMAVSNTADTLGKVICERAAKEDVLAGWTFVAQRDSIHRPNQDIKALITMIAMPGITPALATL